MKLQWAVAWMHERLKTQISFPPTLLNLDQAAYMTMASLNKIMYQL